MPVICTVLKSDPIMISMGMQAIFLIVSWKQKALNLFISLMITLVLISINYTMETHQAHYLVL
jgi:hypothetical protein